MALRRLGDLDPENMMRPGAEMSVQCRCRATGVGLEKMREDNQNRQAARGETVIGCHDIPPLHVLRAICT